MAGRYLRRSGSAPSLFFAPRRFMFSFEDLLKDKATSIGFDLVGIAPAGEASTYDAFRKWLQAGHEGEMSYMQRHAGARRHPESILPDVKSVIMVALNYKHPEVALRRSGKSGKVARYAWCDDYHDTLRFMLKELLGWLRQQRPGCWGRAVVDTAPLLERDFARQAGLGWFGKNTMLLNKKLGSYFFLGALLVDIQLEPDHPHQSSHCGTCTACLDACPTDAFPDSGVLDARRCISYLTIELRGAFDEDLRSDVGDWVFGSDICQEVCPRNRKAPNAQEHVALREDLQSLDLTGLLLLSEQEVEQRFGGTALTRPRRAGLARNAAIALGNVGSRDDLSALRQALQDSDGTVRDAANWAIEQIKCREECSEPPSSSLPPG